MKESKHIPTTGLVWPLGEVTHMKRYVHLNNQAEQSECNSHHSDDG